MFETLKADIEAHYVAYKDYFLPKRIFYLIFTHQLYPVLIYRLGHWAEFHCPIPVIGFILRFIHFFLCKFSYIVIGVHLRQTSEIGPGLKLEQTGCQHIEAKIGKNCRIQQGVTIGRIGGFRGGGVPIIGDNVYIGTGAKILGDVKIGNNVKVGANAVVIKDVPDNAVAVGVPAKIKWSKKQRNEDICTRN
jgi:serine O-acetyltransferase